MSITSRKYPFQKVCMSCTSSNKNMKSMIINFFWHFVNNRKQLYTKLNKYSGLDLMIKISKINWLVAQTYL